MKKYIYYQIKEYYPSSFNTEDITIEEGKINGKSKVLEYYVKSVNKDFKKWHSYKHWKLHYYVRDLTNK